MAGGISTELTLDDLEARLAPLAVPGLRRLTGGASSLTYTGTMAGDRAVVVKVAPAGMAPVLHRDVLRQARVLQALAGTAVPVPAVLWEDTGDPPGDPPLFVMDFVPGTSIDTIAARHPLGLGGPTDLVGAYSYLAGDASRWTTGSALTVDGGYSAP